MKTKEYYYDKFQELFDSGLPIIDGVTNEKFEAKEGEVFRQCYADIPERRTFPKYWFVSNYGNLISVKEKKLVWVHKIPREDLRHYTYKYFITIGEEKVIKNIQLHNLVGLVFGSESFGKATELLKEKGVYAYGVKNSKEDRTQGHHIDGDSTNNKPENIKFVTDKVHSLLDSVPSIEATEEKQNNFIEKFGNLMKEENPNAITILLPGQTFKNGEWVVDKSSDITSTRKIYVTENFIRELQSMIQFMYEDMTEGETVNE